MLVATLLLSALLSPQAPPPAASEAPATEELTPAAPEAPPLAVESMDAPGAAGEVADHIEAGLDAFRKRRFSRARDEFEKAAAADPQSAPAAFYLGYVHYKLAEPSRRLTAEKQQAKELFAKAYSLDPTFQPVWGQKP